MNSVISLDGNDIFAVARMFEQMNINELGDITETIPPELQIFDQNSSAYSSTNNSWKSWLKEFDSLVGLIDAYAYKSEVNSTTIKTKPQTRIGAKQIETMIGTQIDEVKKNQEFSKKFDEFRSAIVSAGGEDIAQTPFDETAGIGLGGENEQFQFEKSRKIINDFMSNIDSFASPFEKLIFAQSLLEFLQEDIDEYAEDLRTNYGDDIGDFYIENFGSPVVKALNDAGEKYYSDAEKEIRSSTPEINELKSELNQRIQTEIASGMLTEYSSIKDATPVASNLIEILEKNLFNWRQLFQSGSLTLTKSEDSEYEFEIESDVDLMVSVLRTWKRDGKVFNSLVKKIERLAQLINGLITTDQGFEKIANTVGVANVDTEKPIRFLATDYEDDDDGDDDEDDDEFEFDDDDSDAKIYHDSNTELLKKDGNYNNWVKAMKKEGTKDDTYVGKINLSQTNKLLQRIGIESLDDFNKTKKPGLIEIGRDLNLQFANDIKVPSLRQKIFRRLRVDDKFIDFDDE